MPFPWWFRSPWKCSTYARTAVRSAGSPTSISFARHASFTDRTQRSAYAFRFGLRGGKSHRPHTTVPDGLVERGAVLGVSIVNQIPMVGEATHLGHPEVPRDVGHPAFVREGGYSRDLNPTRRPMDDQHDGIRHQAARRPHLGREEIRRRQYLLVGANAVLPRRGVLARRRRRNAVACQDVADGLVAHRIAEVGEGPGDAVVAPVTVIGGNPDNQLRNRSIHAGPPRRGSRL